MSFNSYDLFYYGVLAIVLLLYVRSFRRYRAGEVGSLFLFRNAAIMYFTVFSILLGKFVYEGTVLVSAQFNLRLYYLMLYYGVVLIGTAALFNLFPARDIAIARTRLNLLPLLIALAIKAVLFVVERTPMQELFIGGFSAAHLKQFEWHQPGAGGFVSLFYTLFGPVLCVLFALYFKLSRNLLFRLAMLLLLFETSGFYFSKSGLVVPLAILLVLSGVRLLHFALLVPVAIVAVFYLRLGDVNLFSGEFGTLISERLVEETGYANPQLRLYEAEHPPLGYESRYYLGFNTLFDIQPAVDASREAYLEEKGNYGATTSGHAAVSLYAFWGPAFYLVAPILIAFVFWVDRWILSRVTTYYGLVAYVYFTFKTINYLTVDIQRFISFQTLFDVTFLSSVMLVWIAGKVLRLRIFSARFTFYGKHALPKAVTRAPT
jgi:hypothetical protein